MKPSTIYRRAAERIARGDDVFSCVAISSASGIKYRYGKHWIFRDYAELFLTEGFLPDCGDLNQRRECRITALCLMSAIAKSEGN